MQSAGTAPPAEEGIVPRTPDVPFAFTAPLGLVHPLARAHVRLLGPCFKTGRRDRRPTRDGDAVRASWGARYTRRLRYPPAAETGARGLPDGPRGSTSKLRPGPRSAASGSSREPPEKCSPRRRRRSVASSRIADTADGSGRWPESPAATSRVPPFTAAQFHVLLNSLFKVLFNFPSRYLFAIGLGVIFSLTWSLPRTLSCTPKQLDSGGRAGTARRPPYGPITLCGPWPQSRWTWTAGRAARWLPQTPHSARPRGPAVR
jgi:hypothetical protein